MFFRRSYTVTANPRRRSVTAAERPAGPAPITATDLPFSLSGGRGTTHPFAKAVFGRLAAADEGDTGGVAYQRVGVAVAHVGVAGTGFRRNQRDFLRACGNHGAGGIEAGDEAGAVFVQVDAVRVAGQPKLAVNDFAVAGNGVVGGLRDDNNGVEFFAREFAGVKEVIERVRSQVARGGGGVGNAVFLEAHYLAEPDGRFFGEGKFLEFVGKP